MKRVYYVLKNINILNLILLAVSIGLFFTRVYPLLDADVKANIPRLKAASVKKEENAASASIPNISDYFILTEDSFLHAFTIFDLRANVPKVKAESIKKEENIAVENMPTALDYVIVAEKNLFHPERKMPLEKKEEQMVVRPEIIFYGAIITGETRIAYIEDKKNPYSTPGRGKRQTPVVQGAMIGGYKLTEVNPEAIVLVRGNDKMVVNLRDQKDRKTAETSAGKGPAQATNTPQVVPKPQMPAMPQVSPGQPSGPAPVVQPGGSATPRARRPSYPPRSLMNNP